MADIPLPQAGERLVKEDGTPEATWYRIFAAMFRSFNATKNAVADGDTGLGTKAAKEQAWSEGLIIEFPDDGDYVFPAWFKGEKVTSVVTEADAGACVLTVKIGGVALAGSANSVSTSRDTQAHSAANQSADGDDLILNVANNSSCERMSVTLRGMRALA